MENKKNDTGMYIIDQGYRILNFNRQMGQLYPEVKTGDICYQALALQDSPCKNCPLEKDEVLFFNPIRKEWITANAAELDYPGHGTCHSVHFRMRKNIGGTKGELIQLEELEGHVAELKSVTGNECALGAYCEPGSPIFFANEQLLALLDYETLEELESGTDGLIVNLVHPDDRKRVAREMNYAWTKVGNTFETTFRMPKKDGTWIWVLLKGKTVETAEGKLATLAVCDNMDHFLELYSTEKERNRKLQQKEQIFETIMENIPSGFHRCAAKAGCPILFIGKHFEDIVGWTKEEIEAKFDNLYANLLWDEDADAIKIYNDMLQMRGKGNGYDTSVYRMKHKDGGYRWVTDSTMFVDMGEDSFFQGTIADITKYIEELNAAREEAEASNLAKSVFLFNASHDIRTPMNAIQGFAHIIEQNPENTQLVKDAVRKIGESSDILMTLMNDVLELSRIERGKEEVVLRPMDMEAHANKLYEMFYAEMQQTGLEFRMENTISHPYILGDDLKLTRIAMNLLSNAKKFTSCGGTVTFGVYEEECDGKTVVFNLYVRDTGIGMSEAFQQRAFEQFERERSSTDSGVSGSGLGLAIIKRLVDLMEGTCEIRSELGVGTEVIVRVRLPIAEGTVQLEKGSVTEQTDLSGIRVLLVEDNAFNREIARYILEGLQMKVDEAENGAVCIDKLRYAPGGYYDFVFMDIQMPVMDGYVATRKIRSMADRKKASVPIIAMTANAFDEDRQRCLEIGMDGHIGKPFEMESVKEEIARVFLAQKK